MRSRAAFTLFEVAISALILAFAVLSTLALLPAALRAQKMARFQLFASASAQTLLEDFHNPLPLFKGHGQLAPNLNINLARANPNNPPVPGLAWRLRETNLHSSAFQFDLERQLCGWITGVAPVPLEISRRLDSDGDEIQDLIDQGGYVFYTDPGFVRNLSLTADRDKKMTLNPAPEAQKLIFGVTGYAQQNALTSHPIDSMPWYEMYPFPPQWVALRAHGREIRRGPIWRCATLDDNGAVIAWGEPFEGQNMYGNHATPWGIRSNGKYDSGLLYGDGGHAAWQPVTFDPAPMNRDHLYPPVSMAWPTPAIDTTNEPIDPPDVTPNFNEPFAGGTVGWYHGRNWRHFAQTMPGSPWANGWMAFQRLAGFNDTYSTLGRAAYIALPESEHYEKSGWLPVMACQINPDEPKYDHFWYDLEYRTIAGTGYSNYKGVWAWRDRHGGGPPTIPSIGTPDDVGYGAFPPVPGNWGGYFDGEPWYSGDQYSLSTQTQTPLSTTCPATYEMRANYRDRAIDLWNAVTTGLTTLGDGTVVTKLAYSTLTGGPPAANTQIDCDHYVYGPKELDQWQMIEPDNLPTGNGSPHPAQVMALSYLAHASMLMTGWSVPFTSSNGSWLDWDALAWEYRDPLDATKSYAKDVKLVVDDTAVGATSVTIQNNTTGTPMAFYEGDIVCFESDYREWFRRYQPRPGLPGANTGISGSGDTLVDHLAPLTGKVKYFDGDDHGFFGAVGDRHTVVPRTYRVKADLMVSAGASGSLLFDPPLQTDIKKMVQRYTDSYADNTWPRLAHDAGHQHQLIRLCSEHDRAFARKVHEMCLRWAARYGGENPYDWGAPRMMNHQVMTDKPLAIFDLFEDAAAGPATDGNAQRTPLNPPRQGAVSPSESFYRWIMQPNRAPSSWFAANSIAPGPACAISNLGPGRNSESDWLSVVRNPQLAPPSSPGATTTSQWNYSSDAKRYWLNRHFAPFHRCRQLVFWAVDWKSYEDAEIAPTAPMDVSKMARAIRLDSDGKTPRMLYPMQQGVRGVPSWWCPNYAQSGEWDLQPKMTLDWFFNNSSRIDSMHAGNPENALVWTDPSRRQRYIDDKVNVYTGKDYWSYARSNDDVVLGHFGADRNNNGVLDVGPIPRTTRLHAQTVARFNFYDPVMRLNVND